MAEDQGDRSREDLTEEASPHRIEEYRDKGMVAQSREITGLAVLLAAGITTYCLAPEFGRQMGEFMREVFRTDLSSHVDLGGTQVVRGYLMKTLSLCGSICLPICGAAFVLGVLGSLVQTGPIFSVDPLTVDFEKINPLQGLKKMLTLKQGIDGLRLIFKMTVVIFVSYLLVKSEVLIAPTHFTGETVYLVQTYGRVAKSIFLILSLVLGIFAGIDFGFQRYEFNKGLRMTKQEAKQEHREREGDPQIKARIRAVQREMARKRMMQAVKKADVIITNPTHIAIAIVYDKLSMSAPKVVAKGADLMAQRIKQVAKDAGIPLVENVPLARTLYKSVKVGQNIPRALYQAVAEVLAYVYKLKKRTL